MKRPSPAVPLAAGHRKHLVVLFSDLKGSSTFGRQMEVEDFAALLAQFRARCRAVVARHGGLVARIQSDGVLAVFGIAGTREDDSRRAVEAALDLTAAVRDIRCSGLPPGFTSLQLYSGIHAGQCYVEKGDMERGRVEVLGDVPNTAADLLKLAGPGEVLVSERTLGPVAAFFEKRLLENVKVKGHEGTMAVNAVLGRSRVRTRWEAAAVRGLSPFVGRTHELGVLKARLRSALNGSPHTLVIVAEAGMGKSRLLDELAREAAGENCAVLRGYCESYLGAEPLQPFLQILRALETTPPAGGTAAGPPLAIARRVLMQAGTALTGVCGRAGGSAAPAAVLRDAFDALMSEVPVLLIIDDWQWADDASVQVLNAIRRLERPMLVLLATREPDREELASIRAEHMRLAPLTWDAARQSVRNLVPAADDFLVDRIAEDAGGNPLFVEELCHSAVRGDSASQPARFTDKEKTYDRSAWLDALIGSRVARLRGRNARLVDAAAVIGCVVDIALLSRVAGFKVDSARLRSLSARDVLHRAEGGSVRFKHRITRDAIYDRVDLQERQRLHLEVARALMAQDEEHPEPAMAASAFECPPLRGW